VSSDLVNWSEDAENIDFMENVRSLNLRSFTPGGHFLLSRDNLYHSDDLLHWKRIHNFDGFYLKNVVRVKGKYCAVLEADQYGFWETYLSFSEDLQQWSKPLYTGKPAASGCGVHHDRLLLFYGPRAEILNLDSMVVDSDHDGLTVVEEEVLFTRDDMEDTDGDGVSDGKDLNPLRKPSPTPTTTMEIREFMLNYYLEHGSTFGSGGLLIVISDSGETQSFNNVEMRTLSFTPDEYNVYYKRFEHRGDFFRIQFSRIDLSKDGKSAVVEMSYHYAGLAAAGYEVRLKKVNNKWKVLRFSTTWIS
jgi:hypothetical protein